MAKCIRIVGQGVPVRMSDDDAFQVVVRDGDGEYCKKSFWKEWYDSRPAEHPHRERVISKLVGRRISETGTLARNLQHSRKAS